MKLGKANRSTRCPSWRSSRVRAFTLVELLIASTVLLFVALALVSSNISGARISSLVEQQMDGQRLERGVTMRLKRDIAEASQVRIGSGGFGVFIEATNGAPHVGSKLRLTFDPPGVTNRDYYIDGGDLVRCDNGVWPTPTVLAGVTNGSPFTLVDPGSTVGGLAGIQALTNHAGRALVQVRLQLSTLGGQSLAAGPNTMWQGHEIRFFATQRGDPE